MTVQNARPCSFTQLTTDADWEMLVATYGLTSGVRGAPGSAYLSPSFDGSTRAIDMAAGSAIILGRLWSADAPVTTSIPVASSQNRIDRLVLRLDRNAATAAAVVQPVVITGTPSGSPVEPVLQRTSGGYYDIPIARWTAGSSGALSGLVDERTFTGSALVAAVSNYHPPLDEPALMIETDTGRLLMSRYAGSWSDVIYAPSDSWTVLNLKGGWSQASGRGVPRYHKSDDGYYLELSGQVTGTTDGSGSDIFASVGRGYYDTVPRDVPAAVLNSNLPGTGSPRIYLDTNGNLQIPGYSSKGVSVRLSLDGVRIPINV